MADDSVNKPTSGVLDDMPIDVDGEATAATAGANADKTSAAQTLKDGAAKLTQNFADQARVYAEDGKARAGGALDELAKMVSDAANSVDDKIGPQYGQYAHTAADSLASLADQIKAKDLDDLIEEARVFVAKSPAVAVGAAAAIGFVLARLVKSGLEPDVVQPSTTSERA